MKTKQILFISIIQLIIIFNVGCQSESNTATEHIQIINVQNAQEFIDTHIGDQLNDQEKEDLSNAFIERIEKLYIDKHILAVNLEELKELNKGAQKEFENKMPNIHQYLISNSTSDQYLFFNIYEVNKDYLSKVRVHNINKTLHENIDVEKTLEQLAYNQRSNNQSLNLDRQINALSVVHYLLAHYQEMLFSESGEESIFDGGGSGGPVSDRYKKKE